MKVIYQLNESHIVDLNALYQHEWWTSGRDLEQTRAGVSNSQLVVGLVDEANRLKAFCRVLTDYTFKALIFDIIVDSGCRNQGLGQQLLSLVKNHESLASVRHFELYCLPEMFEYYRTQGFSEALEGLSLMRYEPAG